MKAGKLRHMIEIQSYAEAVSASGSRTKSWTPDAVVWGAIVPVSGLERRIAEQVKAEVTHLITIRYMAGVSAKNRVVFGARTFEIDSPVNTEERNAELVLMCKELT